MRIRTKRIYSEPERSDGIRILVDRLWPRGLSKEAARVSYWAKSAAPSSDLRRWYDHDPKKWSEFKRRYFAELDENPGALRELRKHLGSGTATFVFSSKETQLNNAAALKEYLES